MGVHKYEDLVAEEFAPKRFRRIVHTASMMLVQFEFNDGPYAQPDPPHHHPHEQCTFLAEGEVIFFLDGQPTHMKAGDMVSVPSDVPHSIQLLTPTARLIDAFTPLRQDFLKNR